MKNLLNAVQAILSDINAMNPYATKSNTFGEFSQFAFDGDTVSVEWPNLAISADTLYLAARKAELARDKLLKEMRAEMLHLLKIDAQHTGSLEARAHISGRLAQIGADIQRLENEE